MSIVYICKYLELYIAMYHNISQQVVFVLYMYTSIYLYLQCLLSILIYTYINFIKASIFIILFQCLFLVPADDMGVVGHTQKTQTPMSSPICGQFVFPSHYLPLPILDVPSPAVNSSSHLITSHFPSWTSHLLR